MRKEATLKNSIFGLINKIITLVSVFILRHVISRELNVEFIGLEGLFANVLGLFSLVDLGFGTAIAFDLYEPIFKKDRKQISSIMHLFKKIYSIIGVVLIFLSIGFLPIIYKLLKDTSLDGNSVRIYFFIYALGVSVSYFFSYKRTLLFALQRNYVVLNIDSIVRTILLGVQLFAIIKYKNFGVYLFATIVLNISVNIIISLICDKYDVYDKKNVAPLSKYYKKKLKDHVFSLAITNIAWQGITSTDNIIISSIVGVIDLTKNANYFTISQCINSIVSTVLGGVSASIGDLIAENNLTKIKEYFNRYCYIYFLMASYSTLGVFFVSKEVVTVWVGEELTFDIIKVLFISINLLLALNFRPLADYQNYSGNFVYYRPYSIISLAINLVSSMALAFYCGIIGVFIGTTLTYIFMTVVVVIIIYKHIFHISCVDYIKIFLKGYFPFLISFAELLFVYNIIKFNNIFLDIILKVGLVSVVFFVNVLIFHGRSQEFVYFVELLKSILKRIRCKK